MNEIKEVNVVVSSVIGAELEQITARDARTGKLLYAGNLDGFMTWYKSYIQPEVKSDVSSDNVE